MGSPTWDRGEPGSFYVPLRIESGVCEGANRVLIEVSPPSRLQR